MDSLRAIAALSVLVTHTGFLSGANTTTWYGQYLARLDIGVTIFFLLSGFLLYRPFALAHLRDEPAPSVKRFYTRRLLRIIPAYWVALSFVFFVFAYKTADGWDGYLTFFGFAQIYRPDGYAIGGLGQAW